MDKYIKETIERYRNDRFRYEDIKAQQRVLDEEANRLQSRLGAYMRILRDAIGDEAAQDIEKEFAVAPPTGPTKVVELASLAAARAAGQLMTRVASETAPPPADLTVTEIILDVIGKSGSEGLTAGQIFEAARERGVGVEQRNTVYGTLSRLNSSSRVRKAGKRYLPIGDQ